MSNIQEESKKLWNEIEDKLPPGSNLMAFLNQATLGEVRTTLDISSLQYAKLLIAKDLMLS